MTNPMRKEVKNWLAKGCGILDAEEAFQPLCEAYLQALDMVDEIENARKDVNDSWRDTFALFMQRVRLAIKKFNEGGDERQEEVKSK